MQRDSPHHVVKRPFSDAAVWLSPTPVDARKFIEMTAGHGPYRSNSPARDVAQMVRNPEIPKCLSPTWNPVLNRFYCWMGHELALLHSHGASKIVCDFCARVIPAPPPNDYVRDAEVLADPQAMLPSSRARCDECDADVCDACIKYIRDESKFHSACFICDKCQVFVAQDDAPNHRCPAAGKLREPSVKSEAGSSGDWALVMDNLRATISEFDIRQLVAGGLQSACNNAISRSGPSTARVFFQTKELAWEALYALEGRPFPGGSHFVLSVESPFESKLVATEAQGNDDNGHL